MKLLIRPYEKNPYAPRYAEDFQEKNRDYLDSGMIPFDEFFFTFNGADGDMDLEQITLIITGTLL